MVFTAKALEAIQLPGIVVQVLIDGPTSGAPLTMFVMEVQPAGAMPVPHRHLGFEEVVYGMEGTLRINVQGQAIDVGPGASLRIEAGEVHAFSNPFAETARLLCVLTPGVFGAQYFREVRELLGAGGPLDPKKAAEVMLRHGLEPVKLG